MTVTELALLQLVNPTSLDDPSFKAKLQKAKQAMESFTSEPFHFYSQIEDPTYIYIVGAWKSVDQHMNEWIPSAANQDLLQLLQHDVNVHWMFHVDVEKARLPLDADVMAIGRHTIVTAKKEEFEATFGGVKKYLADYTAPKPLAGGWRVEVEDEGKHEWVLFSGWDAVENHMAFAKTDEFREYSKIVPFVDGFDIKHAKPLIL